MIVPAILHAQSGTADTGEVAVYGGGTFGSGAHPLIGGSAGVSFSQHLIGLIEGIIYLTKTDEDFYQTYVVEKKAWF